MVAKTFGSVLHGINGEVVEVESVRFNSRPEIQITGLAGNVVRESRDRIRACLRGLGIDTPSARLVVHLVPATQKKEGSQLDLAIAVAILAVEGLLPVNKIGKMGFLGELRLSGEVVGIPRAIAMMESLTARKELERVFVPVGNRWDAAVLGSPKLELVDSLQSVLEVLTQNEKRETAVTAIRIAAIGFAVGQIQAYVQSIPGALMPVISGRSFSSRRISLTGTWPSTT